MIGLIVILCIIVGSAIALFCIVSSEFSHDVSTRSFCIWCIIIIVLTCILSLFTNLYHLSKSKAIDVYRSKTTLEITYKDNVPIDSVVIFK